MPRSRKRRKQVFVFAPEHSCIPNLNLSLEQVAADLVSVNQPVILVNQAEGGATKMADKWFSAIAPLLE